MALHNYSGLVTSERLVFEQCLISFYVACFYGLDVFNTVLPHTLDSSSAPTAFRDEFQFIFSQLNSIIAKPKNR